MTPRRVLLALPVLLLPVPAAAQRRGGRAANRDLPLPLPPPPPSPDPLAPMARGEPAPVPNRELELPRGAGRATAPEVNPTLIDPDEPRVGATTDRHGPQSREDRLLRQPAPGARLRMPFAY